MFKRKALIIMIAYIIGILWGIYVKNIFLFFIMQVFIAVIAIILYSIKSNSKARLFSMKCNKSTLIIFLIFLNMGLINVEEKDKRLESFYRYNNIKYTIISECIEGDYYNKYIAKIDKYGVKIYVIVNKNVKLEYGDYIYSNSKIEEPKGQRNKYGFDYKSYLKSINVVGTIKVNEFKIIKKDNIDIFNRTIHRIRKNIRCHIYKIIDDDNKYLLEALLIGSKDSVDENIKRYFTDASLAHILAISGMHIAIINLLINRIFEKLGKRQSYYISILILLVYVFIAGASVSVIRAGISIVLIQISKIIHRKSDMYNNICISSIFILFINPYNILNLGFLLSYGGICGIIVYNIICKKKKYTIIKSSIIISLCVQIVIFPILINSFNKFSFLLLISNLLVSQLLVVILNIGITLISLSYININLVYYLGNIEKYLLNILTNIAKCLSNIKFANIVCTRIDLPMIIGYYLVLIYVLYLINIDRIHILTHFIKKNIIKLMFFVLIITSLFNIYNFLGIKNLEIYFIDVGQGDATLIKTIHNKTILMDGGGESATSKFDVGEKTLLPYLLNRKIKKLDYIIVSHFDSDHWTGLAYIIENLKVKNVIIGRQFEACENYENFVKLVKVRNIKVHVVEAGNRVNIEKDFYFDILWPDSKNVINDNNINNNSLVCKLVYKNFNMLFTGDIEEKAERVILKKYKNNLNMLNSTVLKVAHHGSKTSSSKEFLEAVKPKLALIGVGENNTFGHPSNITLENLKNINCKIYRTDENGEIMIKVNKKGKLWIDKMLD